MTVVLAIIAVRLASELANRIHHRMTGRQRPYSTSRAMSAVSIDLRDNKPKQFDVNLTGFDLHIAYPVYVPSLPRFIDVDDRRTFISDEDNRNHLVMPPATAPRPTGRVRLVQNGVIRPDHECSWKTTDDEFAADGHNGFSA